MREEELLQDIKAFMRKSREDGHLMLEEVPSPWGRPDLLVAKPTGTPVEGTVPLGRSDLSVASILSRSGTLSKSGLSERCGLSESSLSLITNRLVSRGLARDMGESISALDPPNYFDDITAIEVKTRDWVSGLRQARRYKAFADEVMVFLGRRIRRMDPSPFVRSRIGLAFLKPEPQIAIEPADIRGENVGFARRIVEENILNSLRGARRRPS